ncbi:MAG: MFS transporter [Ilumatobacter sp.]|nr:MFS transporter [Ilumatobacter sp.]
MEQPGSAHRPPPSKFRRLAITHALMMGGDAAMVVALADSLFFDIDLNAARTRVMLFLALSFAPFLFVAPLIGPMIDRIAGGRRFVIQVIALIRVALLVLMAKYIDALALFPLVFANLVLQKTYIVSKSALVPSTVRSETEHVEANSKLGLIAGLTGAVAVIPAAVLLKLIGASATLIYGAMIFGAALMSATRLPRDVVASEAVGSDESAQLHSPSLRNGALVMTVLRGSVGFTFFHLAFWLRSQDSGTVWFGAVIGVSALVAMVGNAIAPRVRSLMREETMLIVALVVAAAAGVGTALLGGPLGAVVLAGVLNFVAALGRLSFESIVQRDAPGANQGRAFAKFETQFQLSWALAAFVAVAIQVSGPIGFLIVGVAAAGTVVQLIAGPTAVQLPRRRPRRLPARRRRGSQSISRRSPGPTTGRARRSRSGSASRRRR